MRVGFIQFDVQFGLKEKNLITVQRLLKNSDADLWVLPELFSTGYLFGSKREALKLSEKIPDDETTQFLLALSKNHQCTIVAGLAERENNLVYNSAVVIKNNDVIGTYRKIHLFDDEKKWFRPGNLPFKVWEIGKAKIGVMICFDWFFPEAARTLALRGAEIICHPSNLILPYCQQAMITRCLESHVFCITANRIGSETKKDVTLRFSGSSQITGCNGEIIHRAKANEEKAVVIEIDPVESQNKFLTKNNHIFEDRRSQLYEWN